MLRIFPNHDFHASPNGCNKCPPNMCKLRTELLVKAEIREWIDGGKTLRNQLRKSGLLGTLDLNSQYQNDIDSGPKAIDLNCKGMEQYNWF
nr:hypothetical protein CFP56_17984 [Quercus suber]